MFYETLKLNSYETTIPDKKPGPKFFVFWHSKNILHWCQENVSLQVIVFANAKNNELVLQPISGYPPDKQLLP